MLFYVAFVWNQCDPSARSAVQAMSARLRTAHPDWNLVVNEENLIVACPPSQPTRGERHKNIYSLPAARGVVLGTLFPRTYAELEDTSRQVVPDVTFGSDEAESIVSSGGRDLVENYWGNYVAFMRSRQGDACWVIRGPTGKVPCQHTRIEGVDVYFVRITDIEPLSDVARRVNESFLRGYILLTTIALRKTGIENVETVFAGERVTHTAGQMSRTFIWNPLQIAQRDPVLNADEAVELTRRSVTACTHAWASRFDGILLSLSGGLDSSILASCLASAPSKPRVQCQNFYASNPNSDERRYARMMAERTGLPLTEETTDTAFDLTPMTRFPRSLTPAGTLIDKDYWDHQSHYQRSQGRCVLFAGHGGDELFHRGGPLPGAVDHAWMFGATRKLFDLALADSALDQVSVWATLKLVYRYGIRKQPWHMNRGVPRSGRHLLTQEFRSSAISDQDIWHPLYRALPQIPPAKYFQAFLISLSSGSVYFPSASKDGLTEISPLLSQPFMELSLRIPAFLLRMGGRDRSIARQAFSAHLPPLIANRRTKAFADSQNSLLIRHNIRLVREMLLDGQLVRHGVLDRRKLETVVSGELTSVQSDANELARYFAIESWWQRWAA